MGLLEVVTEPFIAVGVEVSLLAVGV